MRDVTFGHDMTLYLDTSTGTTRHLVPAEWRRVVFSLMHNLTHTGPRAMVRHVAKRYIWPEMSKQLTRWAQECHECQQSKTQRPSNPECRTLRSQRNTSQWYTQTWLAHCRCPTASNTYLQPSTGQHDTWSLNQWRMHQPSHAPKPSSTGGNSTLACQQRSSWIKGERSPANTGKSFRRPWAPSPATHWSITNKPKAWWNGNTKS